MDFPFRLKVATAYLSVKGNAKSFKDYSEIDFSFGKDIDVEIVDDESGSILSFDRNEAEVEVSDADFELIIKGFDPNRDVLVRTRVQV